MGHGILLHDCGLALDATWHGHRSYKIVDKIGAEDVGDILGHHWIRRQAVVTMVDPATGELMRDENGDFLLLPVENTQAFVNSRTLTVPGRHSNGYVPNQPDLFVEMAEILIEFGLTIATVGTIHNTAKWFLSAQMPDDFTFDFNGKEMILSMLNFGDSIDGKSKFMGANAQHRIQCANTFRSELLGRPHMFAIKHTVNGAIEADAVVRNLESALKVQREINDTVERLIETALTEAEFVKITKAVLGDRPTEEGHGRTSWDNRFDAIVKNSYHDSNLDDIRGTAFGAIMAAEFYEEHLATVRGSKGVAPDRDMRNIEKVVFTGQDFSMKFAEQVFAAIG